MMCDHSFDHQSTWSLQNFWEGKEKVIGSGLKWLEVLESYQFFPITGPAKKVLLWDRHTLHSPKYRLPTATGCSVFRGWSEGLSVWTFPTSALGDRVQHLCHGIEEWSIQVGWQLEASIGKGPKDGNLGRESSTSSRFPCFSFWKQLKYLPNFYLDFKTSSSNKKKVASGCSLNEPIKVRDSTHQDIYFQISSPGCNLQRADVDLWMTQRCSLRCHGDINRSNKTKGDHLLQ